MIIKNTSKGKTYITVKSKSDKPLKKKKKKKSKKLIEAEANCKASWEELKIHCRTLVDDFKNTFLGK